MNPYETPRDIEPEVKRFPIGGQAGEQIAYLVCYAVLFMLMITAIGIPICVADCIVGGRPGYTERPPMHFLCAISVFVVICRTCQFIGKRMGL